MGRSDGLSFLDRFARLSPADQEAIARHLSRSEQKLLADWLEAQSPQALRISARTVKAKLARNSAAVRNQVYQAFARRRLTPAALASLNAHLSRQKSTTAALSTGATPESEAPAP